MNRDGLFGPREHELEIDELAYSRISEMIIIHPTMSSSLFANLRKVHSPVHVHIELPSTKQKLTAEHFMKEVSGEFKVIADREESGEPADQHDTGIRHGKRAFNDNRLALVAVAKTKRVTKSRKANKLATKQRKTNRK